MRGSGKRGAFALGVFVCLALAAACSSSDSSNPGPIVDDSGSDSPNTTDGNTPDGTMLGDGALPDGALPDTYVPPPPVYVTSTHETTQFGGNTRIYDLSIPVDYDSNKSYPLVLMFHGNPATADGMLAGGAFDPVSQTNAIVAYPQALAPDGGAFSWNLNLTTSNPDMEFVNALVTLLAGQYNVDTTKVYGVGFSGGGFFANMYACQFPNAMRGFASHAGGAPYDDLNVNGQKYPNGYPECEGEQPVAALIVHGMDDTTVDYSSGTFEQEYWAYVNGCSQDATATTPSPCVTNNACPARTPVEFCGIPGLGHGVWSDGYATSWAFFLALSP